jgi:predicted nucleic acid-binding protein
MHVPDPQPLADSFIAATALVHGLAVVTGNTQDFAKLGVDLVDPWARKK